MIAKNQSGVKQGLKIVRNFKAPKSLVFHAFSTPEAFAQWWGPVGMPVTVLDLNFANGGTLHYKMVGNGQTMWGIFHFQNIVEPDLIEFVSSFSDADGNICRSPFPIDFPYEIFNRLTLEENNGVTTLTLSGYPVNASSEQEATYYSMIENMSQGFGGTFNQLEVYLASIQK